MTAKDLLTDDEKKVLTQALDAALDMQEVCQRLVAGGMPYQQHLDKAIEQVAYLEKMHELFEIERSS